MIQQDIVALLSRMDGRIMELRDILLAQRIVKDWYTTAEVGETLDKSEYTVREWCRQGRVRAQKRPAVAAGPRSG